VAKTFGQSSIASDIAHKAKKGTSIGNGQLKRSTMSKAQKRAHKAYRGQGR
jgi:hypothetical protein